MQKYILLYVKQLGKVLQKYILLYVKQLGKVLQKYFWEKYCKNTFEKSIAKIYTFVCETILKSIAKILLRKVLQKYF